MRPRATFEAGDGAVWPDAQASGRAHALRAWSRGQREALRTAAARVVAAWQKDWMDAATAAGDACVDVHEPDGGWSLRADGHAGWAFGSPRAGPRAGLGADAALPQEDEASVLRAIAACLFGVDGAPAMQVPLRPQGLAMAVARDAWQDWLARWRGLLGTSRLHPLREEGDAPPREELALPWSGALRLRVGWCGVEWMLALPYEAVHAVVASSDPRSEPPPRPASTVPILRLDRALAACAVRLRVTLEGARLDLGQIQALRQGDVVPLAHRLAAPLQVVAADGRGICAGWLGKREAHLAVELARLGELPQEDAAAAGHPGTRPSASNASTQGPLE